MKQRIKIYVALAGIVFIVSGFGKALATFDFARLMTLYAGDSVSLMAPLAIMAEMVVGLFLFFHIRLRATSLVAIVLLSALTLVYIYGYFFRGIDDCGCFGAASVLNTSFVFTLFRNAILLYMLADVRKNVNRITPVQTWETVSVTVVLCITAFISGITYNGEDRLDFGSQRNQYVGKSVHNSVLKEFASTSKDSTYLLFAFMYSCSHCLNSIENLKQYEPSGVVDKVIAVTLKDSIGERFFETNFKPNFTIRHYDPQTLLRLTRSFPTAYYIKNDTVRMEISGELPCAPVLAGKIKRMQ
ncbi:MAG: DoxX family protein [Prevotella sp.]|jgi:uncharacterized membrane protein YphA (DoxX/SURF4 family)|nr:DoxX family protein [Prevotella sp.]